MWAAAGLSQPGVPGGDGDEHPHCHGNGIPAWEPPSTLCPLGARVMAGLGTAASHVPAPPAPPWVGMFLGSGETAADFLVTLGWGGWGRAGCPLRPGSTHPAPPVPTGCSTGWQGRGMGGPHQGEDPESYCNPAPWGTSAPLYPHPGPSSQSLPALAVARTAPEPSDAAAGAIQGGWVLLPFYGVEKAGWVTVIWLLLILSLTQHRYLLACGCVSQHSVHAWAGERDAGL